MTQNEFKAALQVCGVTNINEPKNIASYVRRIEFNNGAMIALNPLDNINIIERIDWGNNLLIMRCNERGAWRVSVKSIELVENVVGIATKLAPNGGTNVIDKPDGTQVSDSITKNNFETKGSYQGSVYDEIQKLGN